MVQGNLLALTVSHLLIATQTGLIAGSIAFAVSMLVRIKKYRVTPSYWAYAPELSIFTYTQGPLVVQRQKPS